jgi:hypothetical protein
MEIWVPMEIGAFLPSPSPIVALGSVSWLEFGEFEGLPLSDFEELNPQAAIARYRKKTGMTNLRKRTRVPIIPPKKVLIRPIDFTQYSKFKLPLQRS